jgi:flagellar protein FlgJ
MDIDVVQQNLARANLSQVKKKGADLQKDKALKEACAGFEAIFMHTMIKSMRATLPGNAVFSESNAQKIYQSMQDERLAEELSKGHGSTGLKEILYENLKKSI